MDEDGSSNIDDEAAIIEEVCSSNLEPTDAVICEQLVRMAQEACQGSRDRVSSSVTGSTVMEESHVQIVHQSHDLIQVPGYDGVDSTFVGLPSTVTYGGQTYVLSQSTSHDADCFSSPTYVIADDVVRRTASPRDHHPFAESLPVQPGEVTIVSDPYIEEQASLDTSYNSQETGPRDGCMTTSQSVDSPSVGRSVSNKKQGKRSTDCQSSSVTIVEKRIPYGVLSGNTLTLLPLLHSSTNLPPLLAKVALSV